MRFKISRHTLFKNFNLSVRQRSVLVTQKSRKQHFSKNIPLTQKYFQLQLVKVLSIPRKHGLLKFVAICEKNCSTLVVTVEIFIGFFLQYSQQIDCVLSHKHQKTCSILRPEKVGKGSLIFIKTCYTKAKNLKLIKKKL